MRQTTNERKIRQPERRHNFMKTTQKLPAGIEFVIVFGGPATGKTLNKDALMRRYNCGECLDYEGRGAWAMGSFRDDLMRAQSTRVMILSQTDDVKDPFARKSSGRPRLTGLYVSIEQARQALDAEWVEPIPRYVAPVAKAVVKHASGAELIAAERERQISKEGWLPEDDDHHSAGGLARAASVYADASIPLGEGVAPETVKDQILNYAGCESPWPHHPDYLNLDTPIRALVKAGALCAAEIDRRLRAQGGFPTIKALIEQTTGGVLP